jgi:dihydrofolate synthase/folylpolyglutamate synthase
MEAAARSLTALFGGDRFIFIVGVMADKDVEGMMAHIAPLASEFIAVSPDHPRAMAAGDLAALLERYGLPTTACATADEAVSLALSRAGAEGGRVCALGSLYFSGDIAASVKRAMTRGKNISLDYYSGI